MNKSTKAKISMILIIVLLLLILTGAFAYGTIVGFKACVASRLGG